MECHFWDWTLKTLCFCLGSISFSLPHLILSSPFPSLLSSLPLSLSLSLFFSPSLLWGNQLSPCERSPVEGNKEQGSSIASQHPPETGGLPTATRTYWGPAPPLSGPETTSTRADTSAVASWDTPSQKHPAEHWVYCPKMLKFAVICYITIDNNIQFFNNYQKFFL